MSTQPNTEKQIITILGRRWFERVNGNTYHSVKVFVNNKEVGYCPFAYGYGDQYVQTAVELLVKAGFMDADIEPDRVKKVGNETVTIKGSSRAYWNFIKDSRLNPDKYLISVCDVTRKKDLAF